MRKFPKNLKTRDDIYNCLDMVRAGQLKASDLVNAINKIKNQKNNAVKNIAQKFLCGILSLQMGNQL